MTTLVPVTVDVKSLVIYSDINKDLNTVSGYEQVYNEDAINKSIITILTTRKNTRVFRREFGSFLLDTLFEPMDPTTVSMIKNELIQSIKEWEYRIELRKAEVVPDYANQMYYVQLEYVIPALDNKLASFTFNLLQGN